MSAFERNVPNNLGFSAGKLNFTERLCVLSYARKNSMSRAEPRSQVV